MNNDLSVSPYSAPKFNGHIGTNLKESPLVQQFKEKVSPLATRALTSLKAFLDFKRSDAAEPTDPTTAPLRNAENKLTAARGDNIEFTYRDKRTGREFGKERVIRENTVENHQKLLGNTKLMLLEKLKTERDPSKIAEIEKRISLCDKEFAAIKHLNKGTEFISSAYVRKELSKNENTSYTESLENICLGVPVNFRHHSCDVTERTGEHETIGGHFRVGVMTYQANGHTHLNELKQLRQLWVSNKEEGQKAIEGKIKELERGKVDLKEGKSVSFSIARKNESIDFAVNQLRNLMRDHSDVITERSFYLESQFVHLLVGQAEKNQSQVVDPNNHAFSLIHLALLNRTTDKADRSGWHHNEANQMQDMQAIFQSFDGKEIVFDGKGPYVDLDGNVHMPQKVMVDGHAKKMTIDANFMNVSVQGHTKNDGIQASINTQTIDKLLKQADERFYNAFVKDLPIPPSYHEGVKLLKKVKADLNLGKSSYRVAEDISVALTKMGIPTSVGCMAAKDRTGFVSARTILRHMYDKMTDQRSALHVSDPAELARLQDRFNEGIVTDEGCASRVITDNTGARKLKISAPTLPGIGVVGRVKQAAGSLKEMFFPLKSNIVLPLE